MSNPFEDWVQLAPSGTFTRRRSDGTEYTQLLDAEAFDRLISAFNRDGRDILLDFEHLSATTDDSRAAGWIKGLRVKNSTLEARIRFTAEGAAEAHAYVRRFLSPVWALGPDNRPLRLESVGFTNVPYFDNLSPVLNKTDGGARPQPNPQGTTTMKELALLYGLAETATEADILAAATQAKADADALAARVKELEDKSTASEAETVAAANSARISDKAAFIKAYIANKTLALALLGALKAPAAINKSDARPPSFALNGAAAGMTRAALNKAVADLPPGKRQAFYDEHAANLTD